MERKISLDLIRAFAIISVLLLHTLEFAENLPPRLKYFFAYGWIGVELFFVLSGFLIGLQIFKSQEDLKSHTATFIFWIKRWTRTLPLYFVVFFFYLVIKPLLFHKEFNGNVIPYFFLVQNYFELKDFDQSWSLCIEEQFYFLFPIFYFYFGFKKMPKYIWLLPGFLSFIFRFYLYFDGSDASSLPAIARNFQFPFHTHLDGISWGLALAYSFDKWSKIKDKLGFLYFGVLILLLTLYYIKPTMYEERVILGYQMLAIGFACVLIGLYDFEFSFGSKFITNTSIWSYGMYLWNNSIAKVLQRLTFVQSDLIKILLFFAATYFVSYVTYTLIEKPMLKLRPKLIGYLK